MRVCIGRSASVKLGDIGIEPAILQCMKRVAADVSPSEDRPLRLRLPRAATKGRALSEHWDFGAPAKTIDAALFALRGGSEDEATRARLRRAAVARLALDHFELAARLPTCVMALFPEHFGRLAKFLTEGPIGRYADRFYVKDVRYALGVTVPCGAMQMDLKSRIGPKLILRDALSTGSLRAALAYAVSGGLGCWGNNHIDLRAMKEFNLAGWTQSFVRMSEVLAANPEIRGIAGVSWFYDPVLARISPSLAHLHEIPMRHGAFLVKMTTTEDDIRNATIRSQMRRELYDKGEYQPARYLLAWPRAALLAWAKGTAPAPRRRDRFRQAARVVITAARNS